MIRVVMTTVDRPKSYVRQTLDRLFRLDRTTAEIPPVRIVVDGPSAEFLGSWATDRRVSVELLAGKVAESQRKMDPIDRCAFTTYRALNDHPGGQFDEEDSLILLQDDLEFASGWLERTLETTLCIEADTGSDNFVLALYAPHPFKQRPYSVYCRGDFYGCQALYLTPRAVHTMANVLLEGNIRHRGTDAGNRAPDDLLMRNHFVAHREPYLLAMVPSVVQHIGKVSAIGIGFHESPTFTDERPSNRKYQCL
jgi:hypothetical protein